MSAPASAPVHRQPPVARTASFDDHSDLIRLDLRDIPYQSPGLHVEALQPSFLSRIVGLFSR